MNKLAAEKILLDTNFPLIPFQSKVDIYTEFERLLTSHFQLFILDQSIGELNELTKRKGKLKEEAKMALQLLAAKKVQVLETKEKDHVDFLLEALFFAFLAIYPDTSFLIYILGKRFSFLNIFFLTRESAKK